MRRPTIMTFKRVTGEAGPIAPLMRLRQRVRRWLREQDSKERYLAEATDHADLERRIRDLERRNSGPNLMTFNH